MLEQGIITMKNTNQPSKNSMFKKILIICGIFVGILILLVAGVLLYSEHAIRKFKNEYTEDKPVVIQHEPITKTQQTKLTNTYKTIKDILKTHKKTELQFTSEEFSQMLAYSPETKRFANQAKFWLEDDKIMADLSIPLKAIPQMQGRYLNGLFTISVAVKDGKIHYHVDECKAKGHSIDPTFLKILNSQDIDEILSRRSGKNWREFIESVEIKDSKLTIKTR